MFITKEQGLLAEQNKLIAQFSQKIERILPGHPIRFITPEAAGELSGLDNIVIALGNKALDTVNAGSGNSPVIAVFISRSAFEHSPVHAAARSTAIFSNPSPKRQMALVKVLFGEGASVGILHSNRIDSDVDDAVAAAKALNISTKVVNFNKDTTVKQLVDALKNVKTLLLIKDRDIFQQLPLETLLLIAYDINDLGIIGYSSGVVNSGALATTYTSLDDTVASLAEFVVALKRNKTLPAPRYARSYSVSVNKYVMRSLGLVEMDAITLSGRMALLLGQGG
ncbi:MAG: hypothetical protein KTR20_05930 [Cellvibrionaceae bacterium]|nr:hypothetical protein [Cellvibrionaceae bacterium]